MAKPKAKSKPKTKSKPKAKLKLKAKSKPEVKDDREERIKDLKRHAEELCGGEMKVGGLDDYPAEVEEGFWQHVVEYEKAPWTTHFRQLEEAGVSSPQSLNDAELTAKLWEVIQKLALLRVFIDQTDHLSDRELYTHLWKDALREETKAMAMAANAAWHIQLLSSGSDEDTRRYLKYYADDDWRRNWHQEFPSFRIPKHVDPPYDRDRLLPKPNYDEPTDGKPN